MQRYAVITEVRIFSGDDFIGTITEEDCIGYKAKLNDSFMSSKDISFVGKVLDFVEENGDLKIEEKI